MPPETVPELPPKFSDMMLHHILIGVILSRSPDEPFREDTLVEGLKMVAQGGVSRLNELFYAECTGGPDKSNKYTQTLCDLIPGHVYYTLSDSIRMRVNPSGSDFYTKLLEEKYGSDIWDRLKPLADAVWNAADHYPRM